MLDPLPARRTDATPNVRILLFGGPCVTIDGSPRQVPEGSKRLLAFVALRGCRVERQHAAGTLWPTGNDNRAAGNLRSALWRLRNAGIDVLECDKWSLRLADHIYVDVISVSEWADRLIAGRPLAQDVRMPPAWEEALDLLPGWLDDWTIMERERLRQRVLHAMEALSRSLSRRGMHAEAVEAALAAVNSDPLRESAQRVLIQAHLDEGNWIEARRVLLAFRDLLDRELGVAPSRELVALVHAFAPGIQGVYSDSRAAHNTRVGGRSR
jgi:DNA-binding SARP family transcriptional activator